MYRSRKHFTLKIITAFMFSLLSGFALAGGSSSYDLVLDGKKCQNNTPGQTLTCEYIVGAGLQFAVVGIGLPDTAITFMRSSFDGDFYASYGLLHGCIIIKRGLKGVESEDPFESSGFADLAFVSPRNGKVYKSWEQCKSGW